jgi:hypothetical protein
VRQIRGKRLQRGSATGRGMKSTYRDNFRDVGKTVFVEWVGVVGTNCLCCRNKAAARAARDAFLARGRNALLKEAERRVRAVGRCFDRRWVCWEFCICREVYGRREKSSATDAHIRAEIPIYSSRLRSATSSTSSFGSSSPSLTFLPLPILLPRLQLFL